VILQAISSALPVASTSSCSFLQHTPPSYPFLTGFSPHDSLLPRFLAAMLVQRYVSNPAQPNPAPQPSLSFRVSCLSPVLLSFRSQKAIPLHPKSSFEATFCSKRIKAKAKGRYKSNFTAECLARLETVIKVRVRVKKLKWKV
jgi:hypothetical protein